MSEVPKVAIACQGGGSHAAFAAGVLDALLSPELASRYHIVGLSGTSGGALCAALAWRGIVSSGPEEGRTRLLRFWHDLMVHDPIDAFANFWHVWASRAPVKLEVSPYFYEPMAETRLRALLRTHLDLEGFTEDRHRRKQPALLVGATDVLNGERVIFNGESLSYDDLIASAAVPSLFRAVQTEGRVYWDGLFTTNPPVRELTNLPDLPDEIWVIQVNPQRREHEPVTTREIMDRSNELAGNLSLGQELHFVDTINRLLEKHPGAGLSYRPIRIRVVNLPDEGLDLASKYDRRAEVIEGLLASGRERAAGFFGAESDWPRAQTIPAASVPAPSVATRAPSPKAPPKVARPADAASSETRRPSIEN